MNNLNKDIGRRIADLRHKKGLSQQALAQRLNCTVKHISHVERGVASLSLDLMIEVCKVMECSLDYIVKGVYADSSSLLPPYVLKVLNSQDTRMEGEKKLLLSYLEMYSTLRADNPVDPDESQ